jgi:hypothetical protein
LQQSRRWPKRWHQRHGGINQPPRRVCVLERESGVKRAIEEEMIATQEESVSADVLATQVNATETPLAQGLALERNLFLKLCISDAGLARMRSYEAANITSPARSIEVDERKVNRG